jgi:hypothetical protein
LLATVLRDLDRFRRHGKSRRLIRLLLWRAELWLWLGVITALGVYALAMDWGAANKAALGVLLGIVLWWQCASLLVRYLSPLHFGRVVTARLVKREYVFYLGTVTYLDLVLLQGASSLQVGLVGREVGGTVGRVYVVLLHPEVDGIALPIVDDDMSFTTSMLELVDAKRRVQLIGAIAAFRQSGPRSQE